MFQGFSPETIDFLWGIRMNNNREWFQAHKQQYVDTLYEPMKALAVEIGAPFVKIPGVQCKTSRIYRDMRIQHDTPYKESLWICIRRESTWWQREPTLFFELMPDCYNYGFVFWDPTVDMMNALRRDMTEKPNEFLELIRKVEKDSGIPVAGRSYVRKRSCPVEEVEPYYQLRNITAIREEPISDALFSSDLAVTVRESLEGLYPLCQYCQKFVAVP